MKQMAAQETVKYTVSAKNVYSMVYAISVHTQFTFSYSQLMRLG